jgi:amino acid adenylation domain-containing protein
MIGSSVFDNPHSSAFYPLSYGQQALWFLYQIDQESVAYNIFTTVRISSKLDIEALRRAWNKIIERHAILRTTYTSYAGKPVQRIHEKQEVDIQITDASNWSEDYLREQIFIETDRPFNLEIDSVLRINLFTQSVEEHILLLTMHHIAGDFWSFDILLNEFQNFYIGEIEKIDFQQEDYAENLSYIEFVRWQSELLSSSRGEELREYWQKQLAGELSILNLPTDKLRPPVQTYQGETHILKLDEQLIQKLRNLAIASGTSLYKITLAAFFVLLYRYSNQEDILVGSPMLGRLDRKFKGVVGYFVNPVVLRTTVSGYLTFKDFLDQISGTVKEAQKYQDYPFPLLVDKLQPQRDPSRSPLFQVSFTEQKQRWGEPLKNLSCCQDSGLQMEPYPLGHQRGASFDLDVMIMEAGEVLQVGWQYNTDLFDLETIARMAEHFLTLLEAIATNPEQRISELPLLTQTERQQLLFEWNNTTTEYPHDKCIHQLFEEQVEKTPDSVAVVFENQQLTYRELNQKANQLAHHLQTLGVRPEFLVGICVERSLEMIVGLLGILKAGGAYVPLDPHYPQERLSYMLADAGVEILLTQQNLLSSLSSHPARVICLDSDWPTTIEQHSHENLDVAVCVDNLVYVIYTSGSTGQPKGVAIEHLSLCNLAQAQRNLFDVKTTSRILQFASVSFDASVWEIFMAITSGAMLILATASELMPGDDLQQILDNHSVTHVTLPPSALVVLPTDEFPALGQIIVAGEACPLELVNQWSVGRRFFNAYGPTESTVCATVAQITHGSEKITIGRPINNTQVYILDSHHQPVPIGVPGELHIGGDGLARGYLNRPELTLEKFIPNPIGEGKSERLYKTGDLARYLADGNIEFLGRIDNQVKIRGFRIELGEIEAVLNAHPQIQQAVVIATEDIPGDKRLVAYIVKTDESLTNKQIRDFLKQQLPEYMLPSASVTLDTIPLTPNGKIDKKALPIPDGVSREVEYIAPRTPSEEIIANIFATVLNQQNIGINDNFFSLGGHSLLATQLISRLRLAFNVEIPLRAVFESPTVTQLDIAIAQLRSQERGLILPPIQAIEGDREQLPLSWAQERLWFLNQLEGDSATYNMPAAVKIAGDLDINALQQALSEIVHRHEILRTSIQTVNGTPIQVIHPQVTTSINVVDLQQLLAPERETLLEQQIQLEASIPFNLENAPLIRCSLLQISAREYVLLLTMHHIVSDGWSMGIFISELSSLYAAFCAGDPSPLPALPLQYADFAVWQKRWLSGVVLETQLNYWRSQLQGSPELLQLPTDRPRPVVQTYHGRTQSFELNQDLTQKLQSLSAESGTTLFMTMLAAFVTLLYRYSGQSDILVGTPIANRNRNEIESLIGFFVNTLVLRSNFENNPSFESLLAQVRETTLQAYEHQDVPFEQVVEALQPQRSLSHSPLFQVMFVLQNVPMTEFELPGVTLTQLDGDSTIAKFDLTLSMSETDQGLVGSWEYNTDLFEGSTIERMATHFQNLLSAIVENPATTVGELPLLSAAERHQLLVEWNDTTAEYPIDKCIHQLFEAQVEKTPDAVAVVFEDQQLTYRELNQRANQLAHYLQTLGVRPEVLVGICVERSLEMVVGLLGILKAGGAYVPLDPHYPQERLSYMLADSGVEVLLTENKWTSQLLEPQVEIICLDSDREKITLYNQKNPTAVNQGENLAYIIYTSGTTGQAKGVMITHQALSRFTQKAIAEYEITARDSILQFASINFDVAVEEIYPCLCTGATLILRTNEMIANLETFFSACVDLQLTVLNLPTAYWHQLVADMANADVALPGFLRLVIVGGEKLLSASVRYWQQYVDKLGKSDELRPTFGDRLQLINAYGPTETTVSATLYRIPIHISTADEVPIGSPLAGVKAYILDANQQPVPIGVPGELYIGGDGLARGYLNRPELTQEKFIPNPFSDQPSERLYKTGDLARYLIDGNIEYLGRIDNQVKIRGFRIELGEVEAVLTQHPAIRETVVIARENIALDKQLVAYVVPHQEPAPTNSDLRRFLKAQLPDYMMPSAFVVLEALPLTPNGKVDRRALPQPELRPELEPTFVAPQTPTEELVASIWEKVLRVSQVGINDNFFELGGHSLLATQLLLQVNDACRVELPLSKLFEDPTVASLSNYIEAISWVNQSLDTSNNTVSTREEVEF